MIEREAKKAKLASRYNLVQLSRKETVCKPFESSRTGEDII